MFKGIIPAVNFIIMKDGIGVWRYQGFPLTGVLDITINSEGPLNSRYVCFTPNRTEVRTNSVLFLAPEDILTIDPNNPILYSNKDYYKTLFSMKERDEIYDLENKLLTGELIPSKRITQIDQHLINLYEQVKGKSC